MKRILAAAVILAVISRPAFGAFDTYMMFTAADGKTTRVQLQSLSNSAITPAEFTSGKLTQGHRKWLPFSITRKIDAASPKLLQALVGGSKSIELDSYEVGPHGKRTPLYKAVLTGVKGNKGKNRSFEIEDFSFTFQKITWTWVKGGTTMQDDWEART